MGRRAQHILVVEPDPLALHQIVSVLGRRDYIVASATTAPLGLEWLARWPIDILIAATQIYSVRGVQFVVSAREKHPELAAVLIGSERERALEMDARRHGFSFLVRPFDPEVLLMVVAEQAAAIRRRQRWPRKRLSTHVPVTIAGREGRLRDVSYGGIGFEIVPDPGPLPPAVDIELSRPRLRVAGELVWSARGDSGRGCLGGIALTESTMPAVQWRQFVDQLA